MSGKLDKLKKETNKIGISYQICKCKYYRGRILWFRTKKGRYILCDPDSICYKIPEYGKGSKTIVTLEGDVIFAEKVLSDNADNVGYISHFTTCKKRGKGDVDGSSQ